MVDNVVFFFLNEKIVGSTPGREKRFQFSGKENISEGGRGAL